jgi:hypothetical protein
MLEYFETGAGRDQFGELQAIAVEAARRLTEEFRREPNKAAMSVYLSAEGSRSGNP